MSVDSAPDRAISFADRALTSALGTDHQPLTYEAIKGCDMREAERVVDGFVAVLREMDPEARIRASRQGDFTRWERWIWAARYPDEAVRAAMPHGAASLEAAASATSIPVPVG